MGLIPIVNENDTVATEELRFGDNDRPAALGNGHRCGSVILLSDVDALYDNDPNTDPMCNGSEKCHSNIQFWRRFLRVFLGFRNWWNGVEGRGCQVEL